jgi:type I restriction enzyme S subunit
MEATVEETAIQRYAAYKDSGVEWLGEVPEHWKCIRMKHTFKDFSQKGKPDAELLSVTQNQGVVPRSWVENRMVMPSGALESFKFIEKGDFAISLRSFEGGLEYCHHDGIISPAYTVLKAKRDIDKSYYKYLFKSQAFISELQTSVVGIREGKNISYPELSYSFLPIPSLEEQTAIAAFLDDKVAKIDKAIMLKEKQIELLKERRQIAIHNAVTRGLNPDAKMKDSGVEWIGEIPEHWEVKKVKHITTKIVDGAHFTPTYVDNGIPFLRVTDLSNPLQKDIKWEKVKRIPLKEHNELIKRANPTKGDILLSKNGTIGLTKVVEWENEFSFFVSLCLIKPLTNIVDSHFFELFFNSSLVDKQITFGSSRTSVTNLHLEKIKELLIVLPPIDEQKAMLTGVYLQTSKLDKLHLIKLSEIEKLKEYKASLINEVVTGKVKVV